jgi:hypothetical protein
MFGTFTQYLNIIYSLGFFSSSIVFFKKEYIFGNKFLNNVQDELLPSEYLTRIFHHWRYIISILLFKFGMIYLFISINNIYYPTQYSGINCFLLTILFFLYNLATLILHLFIPYPNEKCKDNIIPIIAFIPGIICLLCDLFY